MKRFIFPFFVEAYMERNLVGSGVRVGEDPVYHGWMLFMAVQEAIVQHYDGSITERLDVVAMGGVKYFENHRISIH
jgi:hypothetical protein